jgi:hypothetical protein
MNGGGLAVISGQVAIVGCRGWMERAIDRIAARRVLSAEPPDFREVDDALSLIVKQGNRAGEVVGRIRALIKKAPSRKDAVEINDALLEIIALTRTEAANNSVSVRTQLAEGLPRVQGDRV